MTVAGFSAVLLTSQHLPSENEHTAADGIIRSRNHPKFC
jgi:hypothetical protein